MNIRSWSSASAPRARSRRACSAIGGIRTLTIDRQRTVYDKPRAIAIDHEILRLLDNLGVAERVLPLHRAVSGLATFRRQGTVDPAHRHGARALSPRLHAEHGVHAAAGGSSVAAACAGLSRRRRWNSAPSSPVSSQSRDRVTLQLRSDSGAARTVTADYVIACDGASSGVRQQLGIAVRRPGVRRALAGGRPEGRRRQRSESCRRQRRSSAIRRGRPPSSSAPASIAALKSCCCRAKTRASWRSRSRSGACSRNG